MSKPHSTARPLLALLLAAGVCQDGAARAQEVLFDFEGGNLGDEWGAFGEVSAWLDAAPPGGPEESGAAGNALWIRGRDGSVVYNRGRALPADLTPYESVSLWVYRDPSERWPDEITISFLEDDVRTRFWRSFTINHTGWKQYEAPLMWFRAGDSRMPRWDRVRYFSIRMGSTVRMVLDQVELVDEWPQVGARLTPAAVRDAAFPRLPPELTRIHTHGLATVITDDPRVDVEAVADRLDAAASEALAITPGALPVARPAPLVIFARDSDYRDFIPRIGELLGATAIRPTTDGYTLHGIAASSWNERYGNDRPVWTQEFIHALMFDGLRLPSRSDWFNEGVANVMQQRLHPQPGFPRVVMAGLHAVGRPSLREILDGQEIDDDDYWQAVSFYTMLLQHPQWGPRVPELVEEFRRRGTTDMAPFLDSYLGMGWEELEEKWIAWCEQAYGSQFARAGE